MPDSSRGDIPMRASRSISYIRRQVAARVSSVTRYCDRLLQCATPEWDDGELLSLCDCRERLRIDESRELPDCSEDGDSRTVILLNGTFNYHYDIQGLLLRMKPRLSRGSR